MHFGVPRTRAYRASVVTHIGCALYFDSRSSGLKCTQDQSKARYDQITRQSTLEM